MKTYGSSNPEPFEFQVGSVEYSLPKPSPMIQLRILQGGALRTYQEAQAAIEGLDFDVAGELTQEQALKVAAVTERNTSAMIGVVRQLFPEPKTFDQILASPELDMDTFSELIADIIEFCFGGGEPGEA